MIATGLDRLLDDSSSLQRRRYALLSHQAAVTPTLRPAHLALADAGVPPTLLLGPEHGYYGVEQDMIAAVERVDPWSGLPIVSLYGDDEGSLRPRSEIFESLDLLVIDLQDVGARYYTYAATAVWTAEVALAAGCEVWVLDRPNPLGGAVIEGNLPDPGLESFVSAFKVPVRHGLTMGELVLLEARRRGLDRSAVRVFEMQGWQRHQLWDEVDRPWIAPSPNMPSLMTALVYPGGCLIEATQVSEGRGTTRPFELVGAPWVDAVELTADLEERGHRGVALTPAFFKPQFQKHGGETCAGVQIVVTRPDVFESLRFGVDLLESLSMQGGGDFSWRRDPYEFISDIPAIDLLAGTSTLRQRIDQGKPIADWIETWQADAEAFDNERQSVLLYD
ncbi:MAG: DUF1343 domain-containing protein [Acidobacteriota bacterium]